MTTSQCKTCGDPTLAETADSCGGLCMPCFKQTNNGRTPSQLKRIHERDDDALEALWVSFSTSRFPRGLGGHDVAGVCVSSLDTYAAGCVSSYLNKGVLDAERVAILRRCQRDLARVVPELEGDGGNYFATLSDLVEQVLAKAGNGQ